MSNLAEVVLVNKQGFVIEDGGNDKSTLSNEELLTLMKKLSGYGYKLSTEAFMVLMNGTDRDKSLKGIKNLFEALERLLDSKTSYEVFFPNFPNDVINIDKDTRLAMQIAHYLFGFVPEFIDKSVELVETKDYEDLRELKLYTEDVYKTIFLDYLNTTVALNDADKRYLLCLFDYFSDKELNDLFKGVTIKNKETLSLLVAKIIKKGRNIDGSTLLKIPRDVLRLMSVMSSGEDRLSKDTKFKDFSKKELDFIYKTLDSMSGKEEDFKLKQFRNLWTSFFKYNNFSSKKYPVLDKYVKIAFNKIKYTTYSEKLNNAMADMIHDPESDVVLKVVGIIKSREGIFARNLDVILRCASEVSYTLFRKVLIEFEKVAYNVDSKVLVQLRNRVLNIKNKDLPRLVSIGGSYVSLPYKEFEKGSEDNYKVDDIISVIDNSLIRIYSDRDYLGDVFLDDSFKNIIVSTSEKGKSSQLRPMFSGSKLNLPKNSNYLRIFVSWLNGENGRVDIDSSVILLDNTYRDMEQIYYGNLNSAESIGVYHSGDVIDAPNGATEFIDIDVEKLKGSKYRYILHDVRVFSSGTFNQLQDGGSEVRAGVMAIQKEKLLKGHLGNTFNASKDFYEASVEAGFDIVTNSNSVMTMIIDIEDWSYMWVDSSMRSFKNCTNIESDKSSIGTITKYMVEKKATTLYDIYKLNILARGNLVNEKDFSEDNKDVLNLGEFNEKDVLDKTDILANWL